ncbi:hypothetical protein [Rubritalea tangerina]|uniref:hypothetical protein n=1 Tax=Rubritalea tangerina TaxID=430798 RepID=UPI003624142A
MGEGEEGRPCTAGILLGWGDKNSDDRSPWRDSLESYFVYHKVYGKEVKMGLSAGNYWAQTDFALNDSEWHHFACVYSGEQRPTGGPKFDIYIDGELQEVRYFQHQGERSEKWGRGGLQTKTEGVGSKPLQLFSELRSTEEGGNGLLVAIDELYVIDGAISGEAVQRLYENNRLETAAEEADE